MNPALKALQLLAGDWDMELSNASFLPDSSTRVHGTVTFVWLEDGAALAMRQGDAATWIIGRDDAENDFHVLYSDSRGVSRVYTMSFDTSHWSLWRHNPEFSQRFEAVINPNGTVIKGRWEKSVDDGKTWDHDFDVTYTKAKA